MSATLVIVAARSDDRLFAAEMADVEPLADRQRVRGKRRRLAAAPEPPGRAATPRRLLVHRGERCLQGRAHGVTRAQLADLRLGRVAAEAALDLHGRTRTEAHALVRQFLANGSAAGRRCVLIIHGLGQHSQDDPVLKEAVIDWLAAEDIRGFCTAHPRDGGGGALYVLLK